MSDLTGTIQGYDAVLSFFKNDWIPFLCATDFTLNVKADVLPIRTIGDGQWKKNTYQNLSYTVALSGLVKFDDANWTGWDMIDNMLNFNHVPFRISFSDELGDVRTVQGEVMVDSTAFGIAVGQLVTDDFNLTGNGALMVFDGLIPCDSAIESITVTNTTSSDLIAHVNYTFSGAPAQVKYRIDGVGAYTYVNAGTEIDVGTTIGAHVIEIIPVCLNGYEGDGMAQPFTMSAGLSCTLAITSISNIVTGNNVQFTLNYNASPTTASLRYSTDGGATWILFSGGFTAGPTSMIFTLPFAIGSYTVQFKPTCANGVDGTGNTTSFTVGGGSGSSTINWNYQNDPAGNSFQIYVNGVLTVNQTTASPVSGTINVPAGQSVRVVVASTVASGGRTVGLEVVDTTTSTTLTNQNGASPDTLQFTWTPSGDTYSVSGTANP